jgi:proline iminopeptidase
MPRFHAVDGTELAYHVRGEGTPLVCLPGGPMWASGYFADLGGLSGSRRLILLDLRGTGQSAVPADPASYRCDRLAEDVAALQDHLDLERADLLGHSAGSNIAVQYAARYPMRVGRLVLVGPSTRAVGLDATSEMRREIVSLRQAEPWFADAAAAFERIQDGAGTAGDWAAVTPFRYARWDPATRAEHAANDGQASPEATAAFGAPDAFDPGATRAALAAFTSPVLVLTGELDINTPPRLAAEVARLFPDATLAIQPGAGHVRPWADDPGWFTSAVTAFLGER